MGLAEGPFATGRRNFAVSPPEQNRKVIMILSMGYCLEFYSFFNPIKRIFINNDEI